MSDLLNQASLVMIPSGYKEDIVYSVVPSDGSGDLSFTRASNGTRVNSAGLVEDVAWNLATNSENFSSWNLANVTVTANDITAPNGTLTADKLTISSNGNDVKQTISVMPNSVYTWTFYVYGGTALGQQMRFYDNTNSANIEYYDYSSSVVLGAWVKIERTFTTPSGCYAIQAWVLAATSTIGTMWVWGAQLNIGSTAKPYFPTTDRLDVPRLTYQNGGGGCPSLLLEKQSTNLITYSEEFDNAAWTSVAATVSANTATSPDGTQNADLIYPSSSGSNLGLYQNTVGVTGVVGTVSCYVKSAGKNWALLGTDNTSSKNVSFDLVNGVVGSVATGYTATIENVGNGWYRITTTFQSGYSLSYPFVGVADNTNRSVTASGTNGIYIWGFQIEISSYPTSYIPTTSSSATRVADACSKTGISSLIGQTEGVLFVDINRNYITSSYDRYFAVDDADATIYRTGIYLFPEPSIDGRIYLSIRNNNTAIYEYTYNNTTMARLKIAMAYKSGDIAYYINGTQVATSSATFTFAHTLSRVLSSGVGQSVNQAILFPTRLTNAELASLTTI